MIVEFAQVVVVLLIVQHWEDVAAGQLWQIPGGEVLARQTRPPVAAALLLSRGAAALFSQAVEVRLLEELLAGQPLGRVHPQTALHETQSLS